MGVAGEEEGVGGNQDKGGVPELEGEEQEEEEKEEMIFTLIVTKI